MSIRNFRGITPQIAVSAYIDPAAVVIGDVAIGEECSLWPMVVARGDVNRIRIGAHTNIQDGSILHVGQKTRTNPGGHPLAIGEKVTVGHRVLLHGCTVGNLCLIGMAATVMDGAIVEDNVIVGAGSLVPPGKRLERGHLYHGSPARKVRALKDEEYAWLDHVHDHYRQLKDQHRAS